MRVQILRGYRGKPSNEQYIESGEHELDVPLADYLIANGHAVALDQPTQQTEAIQIEDDLYDMTVAELKDYAALNGIELEHNMRKNQILSAIEDAF